MATERVHLDMVREHRGLVTFSKSDHGGTVVKDRGSWMAEEDVSGVVIDDKCYDTAEDAVRALAKHYGITNDLDIRREEEWKND